MQEYIATVKEIIPLSNTAKAIKLKFNKNPQFLPGQFLMFEFNINNKLEKRAFSISSTPNEKLIEITVKKNTNPLVSQYIIENLKIGDKIKTSEARGRFILDENKNAVFLAAGSGIAPIMSMIRYLKQKNSKNKAHLIYSNKSEEEILWKNEIEYISKEYKNFSHVFTLTNPNKQWRGKEGRITEDLFKNYISENTIFYICGPLEFVRSLYKNLLDLQVDKDNIKLEVYD